VHYSPDVVAPKVPIKSQSIATDSSLEDLRASGPPSPVPSFLSESDSTASFTSLSSSASSSLFSEPATTECLSKSSSLALIDTCVSEIEVFGFDDPVQTDDEGLLSPEEQLQPYSWLNEALGPAKGIQESVGSYKQFMDGQRYSYFEPLFDDVDNSAETSSASLEDANSYAADSEAVPTADVIEPTACVDQPPKSPAKKQYYSENIRQQTAQELHSPPQTSGCLPVFSSSLPARHTLLPTQTMIVPRPIATPVWLKTRVPDRIEYPVPQVYRHHDMVLNLSLDCGSNLQDRLMAWQRTTS
jgi:hypothetical protein